MSKLSNTKVQRISVLLPNHQLHTRKDISPYSITKPKNQSQVCRSYFRNRSRLKSSLKRENTLQDCENFEDALASLINVERNYVKELINSPTKYKSKSPITSKKTTSSNSPVKTPKFCQRFESSTVREFLQLHAIRN
ncbi:hypothetical protein SteCoe_11448 [Stentor coeruleus]|uniref:Uncharacterized protein n=1 Tax=Stentor coeruleus TaxID=5963 RepID=A0A1R2CD21_9CILI|nr:hypothetical protein SteCoe_11448 [Stentor coeruleus]